MPKNNKNPILERQGKKCESEADCENDGDDTLLAEACDEHIQ